MLDNKLIPSLSLINRNRAPPIGVRRHSFNSHALLHRILALDFSPCRSFHLYLFMLFKLLRAAYFNILAPRRVNERACHVILRRYVQAREAAEPLLEFIHPPHLFARLQNLWDGSKIEIAAPPSLGPLKAAVLQKIGGLQVALVVGTGTVQVPAAIAKPNQHLGSKSPAFMPAYIYHNLSFPYQLA